MIGRWQSEWDFEFHFIVVLHRLDGHSKSKLGNSLYVVCISGMTFFVLFSVMTADAVYLPPPVYFLYPACRILSLLLVFHCAIIANFVVAICLP